MKNYIKTSSKEIKENFKDYHIHDKPVFVLKKVKNINLEKVFNTIEYAIPQSLTNNFENVYIGQFKEFSNEIGEFNAIYKDNTIYVSNIQDNEEDMIDDIVHELAHSLEELNEEIIYADGLLEREFLGKRKRLYHMLPENDVNQLYFLNPEYDNAFDNYLYNNIGYEALRNMTSELFYSPYAITSLREYWANGFENYFLKDKQTLKDLSPVLYNKIESLIEKKKEYDEF